MQFITIEDIYINLERQHIINLTANRMELLDLIERNAIHYVGQMLGSTYDMAYELRPYADYIVNKVYPDNQRLRLSYNSTNAALAATYPALSLIDTTYHLDTTGIEYSKVVVVNPNSLPSTTTTEYMDRAIISGTSRLTPNSEYSSIKQVETDLTLGRISYNSGLSYYQSTTIYNKYHTIYTPPVDPDETGTIDQVDYMAILTEAGVLDVYGHIQYFDQYASFDISDDDRNRILVMIITDIVTYHLISHTTPRQLNETLQAKYKDTIKLTEAISKCDLNTTLRRLATTDPLVKGAGFRFGKSAAGQNIY